MNDDQDHPDDFELEILAAARRLGAPELARFDPARVAAAVRHRIETEPSRVPGRIGRHPMRWLAGLAAAAAIVVSVYLGMPRSPRGPAERAAVAPVPTVLSELDDLSAPELEEVLRSLPPASGALDHVDMAPLGDLDANELERMLRSMEE